MYGHKIKTMDKIFLPEEFIKELEASIKKNKLIGNTLNEKQELFERIIENPVMITFEKINGAEKIYTSGFYSSTTTLFRIGYGGFDDDPWFLPEVPSLQENIEKHKEDIKAEKYAQVKKYASDGNIFAKKLVDDSSISSAVYYIPFIELINSGAPLEELKSWAKENESEVSEGKAYWYFFKIYKAPAREGSWRKRKEIVDKWMNR